MCYFWVFILRLPIFTKAFWRFLYVLDPDSVVVSGAFYEFLKSFRGYSSVCLELSGIPLTMFKLLRLRWYAMPFWPKSLAYGVTAPESDVIWCSFEFYLIVGTLKLFVKFDGLALLNLLLELPCEVYLWSLSIFVKNSAQFLSWIRSASLSKVSSFLQSFLFSSISSPYSSVDLFYCISTSSSFDVNSSFSRVSISNDGFDLAFLAWILSDFAYCVLLSASESLIFVSWCCKYLLEIGFVCVFSAFEVLICSSSALTNTFSSPSPTATFPISCCELFVVYKSRDPFVPSPKPSPLKWTC